MQRGEQKVSWIEYPERDSKLRAVVIVCGTAASCAEENQDFTGASSRRDVPIKTNHTLARDKGDIYIYIYMYEKERIGLETRGGEDIREALKRNRRYPAFSSRLAFTVERTRLQKRSDSYFILKPHLPRRMHA